MTVTPSDLARTLVQRHAEQRARERLRADRLREAARRVAAEALRAGTVRRAWLIGSLAWGGHGAGSDVDLVVEGIAPEVAPKLWERLSAELHTTVDLLRFEELPAQFAARVLAHGEPLDVA